MMKQKQSWVNRVGESSFPLRGYKIPTQINDNDVEMFSAREVVWSSELKVGSLDQMPTAAQLERYYAQEYRFKMDKPVGLEAYKRSIWHSLISKSIIEWIEQARALDLNQVTWVDVGAGYGLLLSLLKKAHPHAIPAAVELSQAAHADLQRICQEVIGSSAEMQARSLGSEAGSKDVISMVHVLEHLPDPEKSVQEVFSWLKPGGFFICEVPNDHLSELNGIARKTDLPHLWFFSLSGLETLLQQSGFDVVRSAEIGFRREGGPDSLINRTTAYLLRALFGKHRFPRLSNNYKEGINRTAIRVLARKPYDNQL